MNTVWKEKGLEVEKYVGSLIKELVPSEIGVQNQNEKSDFLIGRYTLIEVKSAELCTSNGRNRPRDRTGRFWGTPECHKLLQRGGYIHWYAFGLTYKARVVLIRCVPAKFVMLYRNYINMNTLYSPAAVTMERMIELAIIQEEKEKKIRG